MSEALHLGKPYLAVPVKNQFEQTFNAYYVDKLGYGAWWKELSKEKIESFLFNLPVYAEHLDSYPRAGNGALLAKLDELIGTLTGKGPQCRKLTINFPAPKRRHKPTALFEAAIVASLAMAVLALFLFAWLGSEVLAGRHASL